MLVAAAATLAACVAAAPCMPVPSATADGAATTTLPLGDAGLPETRTTRTLAPGVRLTEIVRGTHRATGSTIDTTTRGPWRVEVLSLDPHTAQGHLSTTYGDDVAGTERTTDLVRRSGALAGVNASFFDIDGDDPGDPLGLAVRAGDIVSEPTPASTPERDVLIDAATNRLSYGHLSWRGTLRNRTTHVALALQHLDHPPAVPQQCATLEDPTRCTATGEVSSFTRAFADRTPAGPGAEVILDSAGCVVHRASTRGRALGASQLSIEATGRQAATLLSLTGRGCLSLSVSLWRGTEPVVVTPTLYAVSGRYQLVHNADAQSFPGRGTFFGRNPRTIVGSTRTGRVLMVTVDGRSTSSVGTTMDETAAMARSLGMVDAVNLDGGASTAMTVGGRLVNSPSGHHERAVGDALVYTEGPLCRAGCAVGTTRRLP